MIQVVDNKKMSLYERREQVDEYHQKDYHYEEEDLKNTIKDIIEDCKEFKYWEHAEGFFDCLKRHFGKELIGVQLRGKR